LADEERVELSKLGRSQLSSVRLVQRVRIPVKLDSDSTPSWTLIPEQAGQSERSDAGFSGFTLLMS
jgi:hypothetical protein